MVKKPEARKAEFVSATGKYIYIKLADLITILTMVDEYDQSNKLVNKLLTTAGLTDEKKKHVVRVPSKTVNIFKEFVAAHPQMRRSSTGKKILRPAKKKASIGVAAATAAKGAFVGVAPGARGSECCGFPPGR